MGFLGGTVRISSIGETIYHTRQCGICETVHSDSCNKCYLYLKVICDLGCETKIQKKIKGKTGQKE